MANFPTFPPKTEDASKWSIDYEDKGISGEMEGGYVLSRPRHTRAHRRTITTGYSDISHTQHNTFVSFYETHGTYLAFSYTIPTTGSIINVRFKNPIKVKRIGFASNHRYDIDCVLEEI